MAETIQGRYIRMNPPPWEARPGHQSPRTPKRRAATH